MAPKLRFLLLRSLSAHPKPQFGCQWCEQDHKTDTACTYFFSLGYMQV